MKRFTFHVAHAVLACIASLLLVGWIAQYAGSMVRLTFGESAYRFTGAEEWQEFSMPFYLDPGPLAEFDIKTTLYLGELHPNILAFYPDDCLTSLYVNGQEREGREWWGYCDSNSAREIDLNGLLRPGENTLELQVRNTGWPTGIWINVSSVDPLRIRIVSFAVFAAGLLGMLIFLTVGKVRPSLLVCIELVFLWSFIAARLFLFFSRWDQAIGFDIGPHMEMFWNISTSNVFSMGVRDYFLSYHPPISFLISKALYLGSDWIPLSLISQMINRGVAAIQASSSLSLMLAFLFLRGSLKKLQVLQSFHGIAFLYGTSSIPLLVHMATSLNLDAVVLACTGAVLYFSILLFWTQKKKKKSIHLLQIAICMFAIIFALLTKFSGVLLAVIPLLVVLAGVGHTKARLWQKQLLLAASITCISLMLVFPYYYLRYYRSEGTFFPTNTVWVIPGGHNDAIRRRDQNPEGFVRELFRSDFPIFHAEEGHLGTLRSHDYWLPRLSDTWADFWIADLAPIRQSWYSAMISLRYIQIMPWLLLAGCLLLFPILWKRGPWARIGFVFLMYGLLQICALIYYVYHNPDAGFKPTKAIYVSSLTWLIGYIATTNMWLLQSVQRWKYVYNAVGIGVLCIVGAFMIVNHVVPVY